MHDTYPLAETPPIPVSRVQSVFAPQSLERFDRSTRRQPRRDPVAPWRRFIVFGGAIGITAYLIRDFYLVLNVGSIAELEIALMVLFAINIFWLALSFMTALAGFVVMATGMRRSLVNPKDYDAAAPLSGKTAIIVCTYNEAPDRILGMAVATMRSIAKLGHKESFDLFVLSENRQTPTFGCRRRPRSRRSASAKPQACASFTGAAPRIRVRRPATLPIGAAAGAPITTICSCSMQTVS